MTATDRELLRAHIDGDPEAFGQLFARHRDRLWAVALRTTGNPEDAADALQEGLISAFRRAAGYRGEAQVTTWLHRIIVNACLDKLRANKVRAVGPLPDDLEEFVGRGTLVTADAAPSPDDAVLADERRGLVLRALATLPADQRVPLVLIDMEGFSVAEVARMLGCPQGTVKSRCSRGRARLARLLGVLRPEPVIPATHGNPSPAPAVPCTDPTP